jgi:hypothetical protein
MAKNQNGFTTFEGYLPYHTSEKFVEWGMGYSTSTKSVEWFMGYMEKPIYDELGFIINQRVSRLELPSTF